MPASEGVQCPLDRRGAQHLLGIAVEEGRVVPAWMVVAVDDDPADVDAEPGREEWDVCGHRPSLSHRELEVNYQPIQTQAATPRTPLPDSGYAAAPCWQPVSPYPTIPHQLAGSYCEGNQNPAEPGQGRTPAALVTAAILGLAPSAGFEPAAYCSGGSRSIP